MQVNPYLNFNGQCEEAFKFYEQCLGGKIAFKMTYGESPIAEHAPAGWRDKVLHATLLLGERALMGADAPPDRYQRPQGFSVSLAMKNPADAERIFQALAEGGTVTMPLQQTFWAVRFGMLIDRFSIPWMINCEQAAP
jgi:PhnB protein